MTFGKNETLFRFKQGFITEREQLNENEYSGLLESCEF